MKQKNKKELLGASLLGNMLAGKKMKRAGYISENLQPNKGKGIINLDEYYDIRTHWIALYVFNNNVIYFDIFGVENIPKEI